MGGWVGGRVGGWVFTDGCSDLSLLIKSLSGNWPQMLSMHKCYIVWSPHHNTHRGGPVCWSWCDHLQSYMITFAKQKKMSNRKAVAAKLFRNNPHGHNIYMKNSEELMQRAHIQRAALA